MTGRARWLAAATGGKEAWRFVLISARAGEPAQSRRIDAQDGQMVLKEKFISRDPSPVDSTRSLVWSSVFPAWLLVHDPRGLFCDFLPVPPDCKSFFPDHLQERAKEWAGFDLQRGC
jgi:hypothetical protein